MTQARILIGHCVDALDVLPAASVHACITSPPYYRLREYGAAAHWPEITYAPMAGLPTISVSAQHVELGLEDDVFAYVGHLVHVFRSVRHVLRDDATLWLNLGDGWASTGKRGGTRGGFNERWHSHVAPGKQARTHDHVPPMNVPLGLKRKDLLGVPWRVALALQADGWWLRSEVIWQKPNCLPDPTEDRITRSHETIFQLAKSERYFHDAHAIREEHTMRPQRRTNGRKPHGTGGFLPDQTFSTSQRDTLGVDGHPAGRNARSVWTISTTPFQDAHFAVMPEELATRCVLAATSERGVCPTCGAPHQRIIDRPVPSDAGRSQESKLIAAQSILGARTRDSHRRLGHQYQDQLDQHPPVTLGWAPTCAHADDAPVPAVVLDPFSGAATTALAACRRGRRFVGIEINAEYAAMSRRRIDEALGRMFLAADVQDAPPAKDAHPEAPAQQALFEGPDGGDR